MKEKELVWHGETIDVGVEQVLGDLQKIPMLAPFTSPVKRASRSGSTGKTPERGGDPCRKSLRESQR